MSRSRQRFGTRLAEPSASSTPALTDTEILEKERSLRSTMKLWSEEQIVRSLAAAGFPTANVQSFWRNHRDGTFMALR